MNSSKPLTISNRKWTPHASSKIVFDDANVVSNNHGLLSEVGISTEFEDQVKSNWFNKFDSGLSGDSNRYSFEYLLKQDDPALSYPNDYDDLQKGTEGFLAQSEFLSTSC